MLSSSSSTPSHLPYVGEPLRRSTLMSTIRPRAQRTSLATPGPMWKCMPAHDAPAGAGVVVLDELLLCGDAGVGVPLAAVGLGEEAALVGEDRGLEDRQAGEGGWDRLHGWGAYRRLKLPAAQVRAAHRSTSRRGSRTVEAGMTRASLHIYGIGPEDR